MLKGNFGRTRRDIFVQKELSLLFGGWSEKEGTFGSERCKFNYCSNKGMFTKKKTKIFLPKIWPIRGSSFHERWSPKKGQENEWYQLPPRHIMRTKTVPNEIWLICKQHSREDGKGPILSSFINTFFRERNHQSPKHRIIWIRLTQRCTDISHHIYVPIFQKPEVRGKRALK